MKVSSHRSALSGALFAPDGGAWLSAEGKTRSRRASATRDGTTERARQGRAGLELTAEIGSCARERLLQHLSRRRPRPASWPRSSSRGDSTRSPSPRRRSKSCSPPTALERSAETRAISAAVRPTPTAARSRISKAEAHRHAVLGARRLPHSPPTSEGRSTLSVKRRALIPPPFAHGEGFAPTSRVLRVFMGR